jgi:fructuronate reductase
MAARLSRATLGRVPDGSGPLVRPWDVRPGIVHLGVGAFHRAHQAVYTESALDGGGDWGIVGVAPRRRAVVDGLAAQDGLFSVTSLDGNGSGTRVVGSIVGVRHLPSDPTGVVELIADPAIRIVTLTVTEKGYLLDPATGRLRVDDGLRGELAGSAPPSSIPGLLVAGLRARAGRAAGPLALVSCDNLPSNGQRLRKAVLDAYSAAGADAGWVEANVSFPGTMVDRVVPATTAETIAAAAAALNVRDEMAVAAEPYSEWVIEDVFPGGRPDWESAGAVLTSDARPYERLKLRALNGVHSALAYLGALAGCPTIADALALPGMRRMLERFVADDIAPSLTPPPGRCWTGSPTRPSVTAPSRSRWTDRRRCPSASFIRRPTGSRRTPSRGGRLWSRRPGCGSSPDTPTTVANCRWTTRWPLSCYPRPARLPRSTTCSRSTPCSHRISRAPRPSGGSWPDGSPSSAGTAWPTWWPA